VVPAPRAAPHDDVVDVSGVDISDLDVDEADKATPDTVVAADTTTDAYPTTDADSTTDVQEDELAAGEPVPVPVPVGAADTAGAAKPGSVSEPDLGSLFGEADAQSFQERWRDVQLRFVDSPKDATAEAAALVDEAVDKLTASLRARKDSVSNDSDDTEELRVALRGYREILNNVLGL